MAILLLLALQDIDGLIERLGHDDVDVRDKAQTDLLKRGRAALPAIRKAAESHADPEVRARASALVRAINTPAWRTDLDAALKTAATEKKLLFVFSTMGPLDGYV